MRLSVELHLYILRYFTSGALYWVKQLFIFKTNFFTKHVLFWRSFFRLFPGLKLSSEQNSVRKNLFWVQVFLDSGLFYSSLDKSLTSVESLVMLIRTWSSFFVMPKFFKKHAILHDAAGAVRAHSGKGPGNFYKIGRGSHICLLGHITGLLLCLYVNLFLSSIFKSVDFWSSMSFLVLDIELAEINLKKELGVFFMGKLRDTQFIL